MVTHPKLSEASTLMPSGWLSIEHLHSWKPMRKIRLFRFLSDADHDNGWYKFPLQHCLPCTPMALLMMCLIVLQVQAWKSKTSMFVSSLLQIHSGNRNHHPSYIFKIYLFLSSWLLLGLATSSSFWANSSGAFVFCHCNFLPPWSPLSLNPPFNIG